MIRSLLLLFPLAFAPLLLTSGTPAAAPLAEGAWKIDAVHSTVLFKVKHLNTAWAYGRFNSFSGEIVHDAQDPAKSKVSCEIDVASVDTANKDRDAHLVSPDFFSAREFPKIRFTSNKVEARGDKLAVSGEFEMHGVKQPLTLLVEKTGSSKSDRFGERVGFHAVATIKRSEFGMKTMLEGIGDEVEVTLSLEATR
jgi:polyisoprenoid-binding protein YceI